MEDYIKDKVLSRMPILQAIHGDHSWKKNLERVNELTSSKVFRVTFNIEQSSLRICNRNAFLREEPGKVLTESKVISETQTDQSPE